MTKRVTAKQMAIHVAVICAENNIEVVKHSRSGAAWRKSRRIAIRPVKTAISYAVALHEIGHILGPQQSGTRLMKECGAWLWAHDNAMTWTDAMEKAMQKRLRSYVAWAQRHKTAAKPDCNHPIMEMAGLCVG